MKLNPKYGKTRSDSLTWAQTYSSSSTYISRLSNHKDSGAHSLYRFCAWAGLNPDELLALKSSFESLDAEKLLDKFVQEPNPLGMPESQKWQSMTAVRGFYRTNYRALQPQAGKMDYVGNKPQRCPSKLQRLDLYKNAYNLRDRTLVMFATTTAIALETLSKVQFLHFEQDWKHQEIPCLILPGPIIKGHGLGKYRGVKQTTFLTPETKQTLIEYMDWYSKLFNHTWKESDHVFLDVKQNIHGPSTYRAIITALIEMSERAGVPFSSHDGRRIVQTALESVGCSPNWIKKIKGRKPAAEENPYSKPAIEQLREVFKKALPELEFLVSTPKLRLTEQDQDTLSLLLQKFREGKVHIDE